jgi:GTPase SAR1 family protein
MSLFLVQNKYKSEVHKGNNTKIENMEEYKKNQSLLTVLNSVWQKNLVHDPTPVLLQIYVNIEQIKLIYKFFKTYASGILFCSSHYVEHNGKNGI